MTIYPWVSRITFTAKKASDIAWYFFCNDTVLQLHFRCLLCACCFSFFALKKKRVDFMQSFCLFLHKHTHWLFFAFWKKNSPEQTTRSFPSRNIASGSCTCFEEHFLMCDSLRPIRISGKLFSRLHFLGTTHSAQCVFFFFFQFSRKKEKIRCTES